MRWGNGHLFAVWGGPVPICGDDGRSVDHRAWLYKRALRKAIVPRVWTTYAVRMAGFEARFNGSCIYCFGPIVRGQQITRVRRQHGRDGYRHVSCGDHPGHQPVQVVTVAKRLVTAMRASQGLSG